MSSDLIQNSSNSCGDTTSSDMDPEAFKTPWMVIEEEFGGNVVYLLVNAHKVTVAIVDNWDHAQLIVSRINAYFEGL